MQYRCEVRSVVGLVQLVACNLLPHGYWFYVTGSIPAGKDPRSIDAKLIEKYGLAISPQTRARRKRAGTASVRYLRYERGFAERCALAGACLWRRRSDGRRYGCILHLVLSA